MTRIASALTLSIALVGSSPAAAATESVIYSFKDAALGEPIGRLLLHDGALYGTGSGGEGVFGNGQAFELYQSAGAWRQRTLFTFSGANGASPAAGLILDSHGAFLGTSEGGDLYGYGNVFALSDLSGKWLSATLHAFSGSNGDGADPYCDLVMDSSGNLYGVTPQGGVGYGTVFELTRAGRKWKERILWSFSGDPDGATPVGGLHMDSTGILYGTTASGGSYGDGTVFEISGSTETVLYDFAGGNDGDYPVGGVILGKNGNLYGLTKYGGNLNSGTAFELIKSSSWKEQVLYTFAGGSGDGSEPVAALVWNSGGGLYGTTEFGGANNAGTVFELSPSGDTWSETVLHSFGTGRDGQVPESSIILDKSGNLYGTTYQGGAHGYGTVWEMTP